MNKVARYILIVIVIVSIALGYYVKTTFQDKNRKVEEYDIPYKTRVVDLVDKDTVYIQKEDGNIYTYRLKDLSSIIFKKNYIQNSKIADIKFSDNWILWTETRGTSWFLLAQNKNNNEIKKLYENDNSGCPQIQLYDKYATYYRVNNSEVQIVLLDLDNNKEEIIDKIAVSQDNLISVPYISNNKIVWAVDTKKGSINNSNVFLYDMPSGKKVNLSKQSNITKPKIYDNNIIATMTENNTEYTKSLLVIYDDKKNTWEKIISSDLSIYKNLKYVSIDDPIFDSNLLAWWDNYSDKMYVYNIKKNKIINLNTSNNSKMNQIYFVKNNYIFYRSIIDEAYVHKCKVIDN